MRALTDAVVAGAHDDAIEGVEVVVRPALEATADDVLAADGYLLGTTANFGYMSGALKHFFDTIFLEAGGALVDDGSAATVRRRPEAVRAVGARPLRHRRCGPVGAVDRGRAALEPGAEVLEVIGDVGEEQRAAAYELGGTLAALLRPNPHPEGPLRGTIARSDPGPARGGRVTRLAGVLALVLSATLALAGCGERSPRTPSKAPTLGACRMLTPDDVAEPSNTTEPVDCTEPHTAETFAIGELPRRLRRRGVRRPGPRRLGVQDLLARRS